MKGKITNSKSKIMVSLFIVLAMLLSPITSLFNNVVWAEAENNTKLNGNEIKVVGYEETVEFGDDYILPSVIIDDTSYNYETANAEEGVTYEVKQNNGTVLAYSVDGDKQITKNGGNYEFKANAKEGYTINIYVEPEGGIKTAVKSLSIKVSTPSYSIVLSSNSKYVIPSTIPASITSISIPRPTLFVDGDDLEGLDKEEDYSNLYVSIGGTEEKQFGKNVDHVIFNNLTAGKYQVTYSYKENGAVLARTTQSFNVVSEESYNLDDLKLNLVFDSAKPETATLGKEVTLPSAHAEDQNGSAINAYIEVKVKNVTNNVDYSDKVEDFKFIPMDEGVYSVTYQAKIALFGEDVVSNIAKGEFTISNVKDDENPTPLAVKNYTVEDGKIVSIDGEPISATATEEEILEKLGDLSSEVANVVVIPNGSTSVVVNDFLPAIYASDNYSSKYSDYTLERKWRKSATASGASSTTAWNKEFNKIGSETEKYSNNEAASFEFSEGTYQFRYIAKDAAGNEKTITLFTVKVISESSLDDYKIQPNLTVGTIASRVYGDQSITFAKPSATDKNSTKLDSNIEVVISMKIYAQGQSDAIKTINISEEDYYNEETEQFEIAVSSIEAECPTVEKVELVFEAHNDIYNQGYKTENSLASITKTVMISTANDTTAPVFNFAEGSLSAGLVAVNSNLAGKTIKENGMTNTDEYAFTQGQTIVLPKVTYTDADKGATYNIIIENSNGTKCPLISDKENGLTTKVTRKEVSGSYVTTIENAQFNATFGGIYKVTYAFADHYGNITTRTFGLLVKGTEVPTIIASDFPTTATLNEFFEYPELTLSNGSIINADTENVVINLYKDGFNGEVAVDGFTPNETGEYLVEYVWGTEENQKHTFTLNVEDTKAPVIVEDYSEGYFADNAFKDKYDKGSIVYIPMFRVTDETGNAKTEFADVKVTDSNGATVTYTTDKDKLYYSFKAEEGIYKVTYSASDNAGNSATVVTLSIEVGNCNSPEISWKNTDSIPSTMELNSKLTIPFADLIITDADAVSSGDTNEALKELLKTDSTYCKEAFTLTAPDDTTVTNIYDGEGKGWVYELTQTGNYTLKVVVRDNAGNKTTKSYTINVPEEETETQTNMSNTVGTILIILSVLILASVIVYFLFSTKKGSVSKKGKGN